MQKQRCPRCRGRKEIYKINGGYTLTNSGGKLVTCPLCLGEGTIVPIKAQLKNIEKIQKEKKRGRPKKEKVDDETF